MSLNKDVVLTKKEEESIRKNTAVIDKLTSKLRSDATVLEIHHLLKDADRADKSIKMLLLRSKRLVSDEDKTLRELHSLYDNTIAQVLVFIKRDLSDDTYNRLIKGIRASVNSRFSDERYWEKRERKLRGLLKRKNLGEKLMRATADLLCMQLRTLYSLMYRYDAWIKQDRKQAEQATKDIRSIKQSVNALEIPEKHNRVIDHRDKVVQRLDSYLKQFRILERRITQEEHEAHLRGIVKLYHEVAARKRAA